MKINLLSIKGGGARGVIPLRLLKEITKRASLKLNRKVEVIDLFDCYSGSSIGTVIIAGLLMVGEDGRPIYSVDQILNIFIENANEVFQNSLINNITTLWGMRRPKYSSVKWKSFLTKIFDNKLFGSIAKPVIFPCKDTLSNSPIYFYILKEKHKNIPIVSLLAGTTAAPTYFDSEIIEVDGETYNLLDSGVVVNDTSELLLLEVRHFMNTPINPYELSLGTGYVNQSFDSSNWGMMAWALEIGRASCRERV